MSETGIAEKISLSMTEGAVGAVLSDDADFNEVAFKVLQGQEKNGLIRCGRLSQNGKIKLVFDSGGYKSLAELSGVLNPREFMIAVSHIYDISANASENGFIKSENIIVDLNAVFIDMQDLSVHMICLPLKNISLHENKQQYQEKLKQMLLKAKTGFPSVSEGDVVRILSGSLKPPPERQIQPVPMPEKPPIREPIPPQPVVTNSPIGINLIIASVFEVAIIALGIYLWISYETLMISVAVLAVGTLISAILFILLNPKTGAAKAASGISLVSSAGGLVFKIDKPIFLIGKQRGAVDGVIEGFKTVSRVHCRIISENGRFYVQDMGSMNGTYLNGRKLAENQRAEINRGDLIRISKLEFIVK